MDLMDCESLSPDGIRCDLPVNHDGHHYTLGTSWVEVMQPFDDWADDYELDEEERSVAFSFYVEEMTGQCLA